MTTAHRPTFDPARGGTGRNENNLSKFSTQYSSRDMPSHTSLKYRPKKDESASNKGERQRETEELELLESHDRPVSRDPSNELPMKKAKMAVVMNPDEDEPQNYDEVEDSDEDEESDDDAELMAELERIKKERAAEKAAREEREQQEQEKIRRENILCGNPLLNPATQSSSDFAVKRRWDDDVVFKNCARGIDERKKQPNFINDSIRSEFHRKFMEKYIQ